MTIQRIFVSFRKEDDRATREQLYSRLSSEYGREQIFKSGESIQPGTDYVRILPAQARACPVMLVLIGEGWLRAHETDGTRSIDREHDWVRLEIRTALEAGNRVIPVLLGDDTLLPSPTHLPSDVAALGSLQALRISHSAVEAGLDQLVSVLNAALPRLARPIPETAAPPAASRPHYEMRAHEVGIGIVTGTVHGPVIGGDARSPVVGRDAHGPVVGGDFHQTNVKKGSGGIPVGFAAVLATIGKPFAKATDWAGDHRAIASVSAAVVLAGAGTGIVVAIKGGSTPTAPASSSRVGVMAATVAVTSAPASPAPVPTLTSGAALSSVETDSSSGDVWADGNVLVIKELAVQASPAAVVDGTSNQYTIQTYSIATGQQLATFTPDGLNQGSACIDGLVRSTQGSDVLLVEQTDVVPAQGLTPSTASVDLMGIDAGSGNRLWNASLPVLPGTSNQSNFCSRTDPPAFLTYTADGKFALDPETGTTYLVNLSTGAVSQEPSNTEVLGRWLVKPSAATVSGEGYPVNAAIVDPSSGATITTITDSGTGVTGDIQGGDAGMAGPGEGLGVDAGGSLDLVVGSRLTNNEYGYTAAYSLPSFQRIWAVPNGSIHESTYGDLAFDPTEPGIAIGFSGPSPGNDIVGIDVKTGATLWTVSTASYYCGTTNGHVYAIANNQLVELDEATGKQISYDAAVSNCPLVLKGVIDEVTSASSGSAYANDFITG